MSPASTLILPCLLLAVLAGCGATTIDNSTTLAALSASGKGGVVVRVDMMGTCSGATLILGKRSGDTYQYAATINQDVLFVTTGVAHVELEPGEYHVVGLQCLGNNTVTLLGKGSFGVYKQSYGRFEVRAGEIVNIGLLKMIYVGTKTVHLAVGQIPEYHMSEFRQKYPNLAAQMHTRLLELPIPRLSDGEMVKYCEEIAKINGTFQLPTHPACQRRHEENLRRLDTLDPGRPALMQ